MANMDVAGTSSVRPVNSYNNVNNTKQADSENRIKEDEQKKAEKLNSAKSMQVDPDKGQNIDITA